MSRVHFISLPHPMPDWSGKGPSVSALCGEKIPNAKPVMTINWTERQISAVSTLRFCKDCWLIVMQPNIERRKYIYGVLSYSEADKVNKFDARGAEE